MFDRATITLDIGSHSSSLYFVIDVGGRLCPVSERLAKKLSKTRIWANAQPDVRPAEHRWRRLFNAAKFG